MDDLRGWKGSVPPLAATLISPLGQGIPEQTVSDARKEGLHKQVLKQKLAVPPAHLQDFTTDVQSSEVCDPFSLEVKRQLQSWLPSDI